LDNTEGAYVIALAYHLARVDGRGEGPAIAAAAHRVWQQARDPLIRALADELRNRRLAPRAVDGVILGPEQIRVWHADRLARGLLDPSLADKKPFDSRNDLQ
jgi:hypothetical protein